MLPSILTSNLVCHVPFTNEVTARPTAYNATLFGTASYEQGVFGKGLRHDATGEYATIPTIAATFLSKFSVAILAKAESGGSFFPVNKYSTATSHFRWYFITSDNNTGFDVLGGGVDQQARYTDNLGWGKWRLMIATYDGSLANSNVVLYVNGVKTVTAMAKLPSGDGHTTPIVVGRLGTAGAYVYGTTQHFMYWDEVLSDKQAAILYKHYRGSGVIL